MLRGGLGAFAGFAVVYQTGTDVPQDLTAAFAFVFALGGEYFAGNVLNIMQNKLEVKTLLEMFKKML